MPSFRLRWLIFAAMICTLLMVVLFNSMVEPMVPRIAPIRNDDIREKNNQIATRKIVLPYPNENNIPPLPCGENDVSKGELGTFRFWGKDMNSSWSCPTAGMNNQMQMLMYYHNCQKARGEPILKWKDISCSPTGGVHKDGGSYAVGSSSYKYTWFRWSSMFNVSNGGICFSDNYTWSMHPWIRDCKLTDNSYKKFYGTEAYWQHRPMFNFRQSFYNEVENFLKQTGIGKQQFLAVHLRKGDYSKFCGEITKNYKKLRLSHWHWARKRGTRDVYSKHMDTCSPSHNKVIAGINKLVAIHNLKHVVMSTTHPEYRPGNVDFENSINATVHAFDPSGYEMSKASFTAIDSIILARASHKLLNRYSTLSLTAVDLSVINNWFDNETMWFW